MIKTLNSKQAIAALDAIDAPTVARARYEAEKVLMEFLHARVALAYTKAIERAASNQEAHRDATTRRWLP